jgi:hypothetical protein
MLMKEKFTVTGATNELTARISNKGLNVTDNLLGGTGFSFVKESQPGIMLIRKQGVGAVSGNLTWYYFTEGDKLSSLNKELSLKKELFWFNDSTATWQAVIENTLLKVGDKVRVNLSLETKVPLRYVYLDDKRAASFEPVEVHSGYEYGNNIGYYKSIRDQGIQLFASVVPAGKTVFSYEMKVSHEGRFINGPASLQCMYNPAISAYSNSLVIKSVK